MTPQLSIRPVRLDEAANLLQLAEAIFRQSFEHLNDPVHFEAYMSEAYNLAQFQKELVDPNSAYFFALSGDDIAGYLKLNWGEAQTELQTEPGMEIQRIYIKPEFQGQKIGQFLLEQTIKMANKQGLSFVWLGVWEKNEAARRFYERNGFKHFSSHTFMVGTDPQTDHLLKLNLN